MSHSEELSDKLPHELFGGGAKPGSTRENILDQAQDLFYSHGFHDVALDQVIERAGITKTTFYRHFESRDQLILNVIQHADKQVHGQFMQDVRARAGWDPCGGLLAMFDVMDEWFNSPDFRGCIFIAACISFPNWRDPIHKAASGHYLATTDEVEEMAQAAGIEQPREFAEEWVLLIEGAVSRRLLTGDNGSARMAKRIAERTLAQLRARDASADHPD